MSGDSMARIIPFVAGAVAVSAAFAGSYAVLEDDPVPPPPQILTIKVDSETGLPGCNVPTADFVPEPCVAVWNSIKAMLTSVQVAELYKKWKASNPGEYQRLTVFMASGTGTQVPSMVTAYGMSLIQAVQAYIYAFGPQPLEWPEPPPQAPAGSKDKKPPTSPGAKIEPPSPSPSPTVPG